MLATNWTARLRQWIWPSRPVPERRAESGEHSANILSAIVFAWTAYLVGICNSRSLDINDIGQLNPNRRLQIRIAELTRSLEFHHARGSSRPLQRAVYSCFRKEILTAACLGACNFVVLYANLFATRYFGLYLRDCHDARHGGPVNGNTGFGKGVGLVAAIVSCWLTGATIMLHARNMQASAAGELRNLVKSCLLRKSARIDQTQPRSAAKDGTPVNWSTGVVLAIMSTDVERIHEAVAQIVEILVIIVFMPLGVLMGYYLFHWPGLIVPAFSLCTLAVMVSLNGRVSKHRAIMNALMDERITYVHDTLQGIRLTKYLAWELVYFKKIMAVRDGEIAQRKRLTMWFLIRRFLLFAINRPMLTLSVALYVYYIGSVRDFWNILPYMFSQQIIFLQFTKAGPAFDAVSNAGQSWGRIEEYLFARERSLEASFVEEGLEQAVEISDAQFVYLDPGSATQQEKHAATLENGISSMDNASAPFELGPIDLSIKRGEFIAIVGSVACGKTSLAAALTGGLFQLAGSVRISSPIAYCAQSPWIQSASVRENILFGESLESERYERILDVCCLRDDLKQFPSGDETELGERGINISGGQAARIQLARSLYQDRDIIILDDPLSAVDAHTGMHIFERAFVDYAREKTRILITHQLQLLRRCDRVVWMEQGRIRGVGSLETLEQDPAFVGTLGLTAMLEDEDEHSSMQTDPANMETTKHEVYEPGRALMQIEERQVASMPWRLYVKYSRLGASWPYLVFLTFLLIISQILNIIYMISYAWWADETWSTNTRTNVAMILSFCLAYWISWNWAIWGEHMVFINAAHRLSGLAMRAVLRAPVAFFDTTPIGRIINRFTLDLNMIDADLPGSIWWAVEAVFAISSLLAICVAYVPTFAAIFIVWAMLSYVAIWIFRAVSREVKRLLTLRDSMIIAKSSEFLSGIATIKTCNRSAELLQDLDDTMDEYNSIYLTAIAAESWILMRQQFLASITTAMFGFVILASRFRIAPALLLFIFICSWDFTWYAQKSTELINQMQRGFVAVERLLHYAESLPNEGPERVDGFNKAGSWPSKGEIRFNDICMRYRPELPVSLDTFSLVIQPGQKVAIIGRSGAGKSSIFAALLRTVSLASGNITIDGEDISTMGIHDLRDAIAVIPQNPTLFLGTVRSNLDPEGRYSDAELYEALLAASLIDKIPGSPSSSSDADRSGGASTPSDVGMCEKDPKLWRRHAVRAPITLETHVDTDGRDFSHGDRQLMALARALVRRSRIIISDEATSSVDPMTDLRVQQALRSRGMCVGGGKRRRRRTTTKRPLGNVGGEGVSKETSSKTIGKIHISPLSTSEKPRGESPQVPVEGEKKKQPEPQQRPITPLPATSPAASAVRHETIDDDDDDDNDIDNDVDASSPTVISIAHRVRTILQYDVVVVMERGRCVEVGAPRELWARRHGYFRGVCERSRVARTEVFGEEEEEEERKGRETEEGKGDEEGERK